MKDSLAAARAHERPQRLRRGRAVLQATQRTLLRCVCVTKRNAVGALRGCQGGRGRRWLGRRARTGSASGHRRHAERGSASQPGGRNSSLRESRLSSADNPLFDFEPRTPWSIRHFVIIIRSSNGRVRRLRTVTVCIDQHTLVAEDPDRILPRGMFRDGPGAADRDRRAVGAADRAGLSPAAANASELGWAPGGCRVE